MNLQILNHETVLSLLPQRHRDMHKGNAGKILMLCGSLGCTGAAALCTMGALRSGAGLVYLGVPESIYAIEAVKLTEPIVFPLPEQGGMFSEEAVSYLSNRLSKIDAVVIGPGIGKSKGTLALVQWILDTFEGPVVVDADGINVLAAHKDIVRGRTAPTILTPHEMEFQRLGGRLTGNRPKDAGLLAQELGAVVVLKGCRTVITDGFDYYVNPTGNPGMATGGSGDVLSGVIAALLGQGLTPMEAAACGAWLHGAAGDICAEEIGQYGMLPSDMLSVLPRLMK